MRKAIVTGANGFLGAALCRKLSLCGVEVIAVVRNEMSDISAIEGLQGVNIVYCDMSEYVRLGEVISDRDVDIFYHFAWEGSAGALRGDERVQLKNVEYSCDAMRGCSEIQCKRFVFASSIMEYEVNALLENRISPSINSIYSCAKSVANQMLRILAADKQIIYFGTVISNIYGPGEKSPRFINSTIRKMLRGEHCSFTTGEQMYDFVYVDDAVEYLYAIGEKGKENQIYYIGSLKPKPLKEFIQEMVEQVNPALEIGFGEIPFQGISLTYQEFDIYAVKNDTGIEPVVNFADGIQRTMEWVKGEEGI